MKQIKSLIGYSLISLSFSLVALFIYQRVLSHFQTNDLANFMLIMSGNLLNSVVIYMRSVYLSTSIGVFIVALIIISLTLRLTYKKVEAAGNLKVQLLITGVVASSAIMLFYLAT